MDLSKTHSSSLRLLERTFPPATRWIGKLLTAVLISDGGTLSIAYLRSKEAACNCTSPLHAGAVDARSLRAVEISLALRPPSRTPNVQMFWMPVLLRDVFFEDNGKRCEDGPTIRHQLRPVTKMDVFTQVRPLGLQHKEAVHRVLAETGPGCWGVTHFPVEADHVAIKVWPTIRSGGLTKLLKWCPRPKCRFWFFQATSLVKHRRR